MRKVMVVLLCLVGITAMAQNRERPNRDGMNDLTVEQMATLQTKKMTLALDLTQEQQTQIQVLNLEKAEARKAQMQERKEAKENGEGKKPSSQERYALQNERLDRMIAHKAEMKTILSEKQYERWEKLTLHKTKHKKKGPDKRHSKK